MNIKFTDRKTFLASLPIQEQDTKLISISSTHSDYRKMRKALSKKLEAKTASCFQFLDIDSQESGFTLRTAEFMLERIDHWMSLGFASRRSGVLIHCDMGVSRSGAVAKWINDYYGLDDRYLNEYNCYNTYIYQMLMKAAGVDLKSWYESQQGEVK